MPESMVHDGVYKRVVRALRTYITNNVQLDSTITNMVMEAMEEDSIDGRLTQLQQTVAALQQQATDLVARFAHPPAVAAVSTEGIATTASSRADRPASCGFALKNSAWSSGTTL